MDANLLAWEIIEYAVSEVNEMLPKSQHIPIKPEAIILGNDAHLDSLALLNFYIFIEDRLSYCLGRGMSLVERLLDGDFEIQTLGDIALFVENEIKASSI